MNVGSEFADDTRNEKALRRSTRPDQVIQNTCVFSSDRRYRYLLRHTWEPLFPPKYCVWIGLNPSVADETHLDPTLKRIRSFSIASGYNGFVMTNLFGLVATDPDRLHTVNDPVGPENDHYILQAATETGKVVAAWGILGGHQKRCETVLKMLTCFEVMCLQETKAGYPIHPLYVAGDTGLVSYRKPKMLS
jgi:hypothetical protein